MKRVVLVRASEWEGLYVDGLLQTESHSIDARTLLDLIDDSELLHLTPKQDKALCLDGHLPNKLEDVSKLGDSR